MLNRYSVSVALVVAAIPTYLVRLSLLGIPTNVFELLVAGVVAAGCLMPPVRQQWREAERQLPRAVLLLVGAFVVAALASTMLADVPRVSFGIFKSWVIIPLLLGWAVYAEARTKQANYRIQNALILSGTVVALLSLIHFTPGERLAGIYDVPNSLALYLAPLITLAAARLFPSPEARARYWYGAALLVMAAALLLTQSLAGVLSVGVGVGLILLSRRKLVAAVGITIICLLVVVPLYADTPTSLAVRLQLWSVSRELIAEHPLLGVGLGQFEPAYQQKLHERFANIEVRMQNLETHSLPLREFVYRDPHNWILSFWLNTGLLGVLSFAGLHVWLWWKTRRLLTRPEASLPVGQTESYRATRYSLLTAAAALVTLLLFGLVDTIYWKNDLAVLQWVLIGVMLNISRKLDR